MLKLGILLMLLVGAAAAVVFVPLHGRTVLERWEDASGPADFASRAWAEARAALGAPARSRRPGHQQTARASKPAPRPEHATGPTERHSDADRAALDRIITEHASR